MKAINFRAVSIVKYEAGIVDWAKEELQVMDRKTRNLMTIYRALHLQAAVDRLYFKKIREGTWNDQHRRMSSEEAMILAVINTIFAIA